MGRYRNISSEWIWAGFVGDQTPEEFVERTTVSDYVQDLPNIFPDADFTEEELQEIEESLTEYIEQQTNSVFWQECNGCGRRFRVNYATGDYVDEPCECECPYSPVDGAPSISEWKEMQAAKGKP